MMILKLNNICEMILCASTLLSITYSSYNLHFTLTKPEDFPGSGDKSMADSCQCMAKTTTIL